jgi:hypothetical protein
MKLKGRLVCLDTQEFRDSIYVRIDGRKVAGTWHNLKEGRSRSFEYNFENDELNIEVWERDPGPSADDLIGRQSIDANNLVGKGEQSVTFTGRGAKYRLFFYIYPDDSTC